MRDPKLQSIPPRTLIPLREFRFFARHIEGKDENEANVAYLKGALRDLPLHNLVFTLNEYPFVRMNFASFCILNLKPDFFYETLKYPIFMIPTISQGLPILSPLETAVFMHNLPLTKIILSHLEKTTHPKYILIVKESLEFAQTMFKNPNHKQTEIMNELEQRLVTYITK